MKHHINWWIVT